MKPVDTLRNSHVQLAPLKWLNTYEHVVSMPRTKFQSLDMLPQELVQMVDAVYAEDWALYQAVRCKCVTRNPHEFVKIVHVCIHSILRLFFQSPIYPLKSSTLVASLLDDLFFYCGSSKQYSLAGRTQAWFPHFVHSPVVR
jgi:hypothetical protein